MITSSANSACPFLRTRGELPFRFFKFIINWVKRTRILKPTPRNIEIAASVIKRGGLVAFPTETVYGLGADATNEDAVRKIFEVKRRPLYDPVIVHVSSFDMLKEVVKEVPEDLDKLSRFMPGPLTLILMRGERIPPLVSAGLPTVAVRMPASEIALSLIERSGVPIAAPSANLFGRPSSTKPEHVLHDLGGRIDIILDGGETRIGIESTVLDITKRPPEILRPGGITKEELEEVLGEVVLKERAGRPKSPGQLKKHYSPRAKLLLFESYERMEEEIKKLGGKIGIMVPIEDAGRFEGRFIVKSPGSFSDLEGYGRRLFSTMRELDEEGVDYILAIAPPRRGVGLSIFDRLFKASGSEIK